MNNNNMVRVINIKSDEVNEIMTAAPAWITRWGTVVFFLFMAVIAVIAGFIKFPETVTQKAVIYRKAGNDAAIAGNQYAAAIVLSQTDRSTIEKGQRVTIVLDAYSNKAYGILEGKVDSIRFNGQSSLFDVTVQLTDSSANAYLQPGLTGKASIHKREETLLHKILPF